MSNKGFELSLNYNALKTKDIEWNVYGVYSKKQKPGWKTGLTKSCYQQRSRCSIYLIEGQPAGVFLEPILLPMQMEAGCWIPYGLEQTEKGTQKAYVAGSEIPAGSYVEGGVLYTPQRDANGQPTGAALNKIIGDPNPDFTMSLGTNFTYKNSLFWLLLRWSVWCRCIQCRQKNPSGCWHWRLFRKRTEGRIAKRIHSFYLSCRRVEGWRWIIYQAERNLIRICSA